MEDQILLVSIMTEPMVWFLLVPRSPDKIKRQQSSIVNHLVKTSSNPLFSKNAFLQGFWGIVRLEEYWIMWCLSKMLEVCEEGVQPTDSSCSKVVLQSLEVYKLYRVYVDHSLLWCILEHFFKWYINFFSLIIKKKCPSQFSRLQKAPFCPFLFVQKPNTLLLTFYDHIGIIYGI